MKVEVLGGFINLKTSSIRWRRIKLDQFYAKERQQSAFAAIYVTEITEVANELKRKKYLVLSWSDDDDERGERRRRNKEMK